MYHAENKERMSPIYLSAAPQHYLQAHLDEPPTQNIAQPIAKKIPLANHYVSLRTFKSQHQDRKPKKSAFITLSRTCSAKHFAVPEHEFMTQLA